MFPEVVHACSQFGWGRRRWRKVGRQPIFRAVWFSYTAGMISMRPSPCLSLEARDPAKLRLKIAARCAAGWIVDGPQVIVTDFSRRGRAVKRYVQAMWRARPQPPRWAPLA